MKTKEIKTNVIIVDEAIRKVKKQFKSGINVSELDMSAIEEVIERVNAIHKPKERERALRTFDRALDRFAEYIAKHSTDEGFYTEKTNKNDVESEAQLKAGMCDKRRAEQLISLCSRLSYVMAKTEVSFIHLNSEKMRVI